MMEGWKEYKIKDYPVKVIDGDRGNNYPKKSEFLKHGYCVFLNTGNVTNNGFDFSNIDFITKEKDEKLRKGKLIRYDTVLTTRGTVGNVSYFSENVNFENIRINSGMVILRPNTIKLNPDYFYQLIKSSIFSEQVNAFKYGAAQPQLPIGTLNYIKLPLPPLPTQRKIAKILSAYDDLIENNLKRIKLLEEMAQKTYEEWFVRMKFPRHETAKFDKETGLPEGWKKVKLGEVCEFKYGKMPKKQLQKENGYPIYSGYRITGYYPEFLFEKPTLIVVARGVGGTGDVKISPRNCWLTNLSIAVLVKIDIYQNYLYYHLKDLNLRYLDSGAAQSQITINSLERIYVIKPNINVQQRFNDYVNLIFMQIENLQTQNQYLKEARDILLPRLMTGMIDTGKISGQVVKR